MTDGAPLTNAGHKRRLLDDDYDHDADDNEQDHVFGLCRRINDRLNDRFVQWQQQTINIIREVLDDYTVGNTEDEMETEDRRRAEASQSIREHTATPMQMPRLQQQIPAPPTTTNILAMSTDQRDGLDDVLVDDRISIRPPSNKRIRDERTGRIVERSTEDTLVVKRNGNSTDFTLSKKDKLLFCDNSIILFVGEENEQVRKDVTNSLMLAQLHADRCMQEFKKKTGSAPMLVPCLEEWYSKFLETFHHMNWVDIGFQTTKVQAAGRDMSVEKVILQLMESLGNQEERSKFRKAMAVLKALPSDDQKLTLFKQRSAEKDFSQFLVHMVYINAKGDATMKTGMIGVSTKETVTNILWFEWRDTNTQVYKADHTMMLGSATFDRMRPLIEDKIQNINESYVNQIPF